VSLTRIGRTIDLSVAATAVAAYGLVLAAAPMARADTAGDTRTGSGADRSRTRDLRERDAKEEAPIVAYAYSANGPPAQTIGAAAYGLGLVGPGQRATAGGGITAWGSPVDRLTIVVDLPRDVYLLDHFAPSVTGIVRLFGIPRSGLSLGVLGKYKVEGFGTDPDGNTESEIETGLVLSYVRAGFHLDANAISGFGLTADGEIDTEGRLRIGYDVSDIVRIGVDGQGRYRLAGDLPLPGNRTWDFAAGPQVVVGKGHVFGALTAGPATMGLTTTATSALGWTAFGSFGGAI
jgi:hypothetical protein